MEKVVNRIAITGPVHTAVLTKQKCVSSFVPQATVICNVREMQRCANRTVETMKTPAP